MEGSIQKESGETLRRFTIHALFPLSIFTEPLQYPLDLAHNLVVAHKTCNMNKSDYLPAVPHLERWVQRNEDRCNHLTQLFNEIGAIHNLPASLRVAHWAFEQAETDGADVWLKAKNLCVLDPRWHELLITT